MNELIPLNLDFQEGLSTGGKLGPITKKLGEKLKHDRNTSLAFTYSNHDNVMVRDAFDSIDERIQFLLEEFGCLTESKTYSENAQTHIVSYPTNNDPNESHILINSSNPDTGSSCKIVSIPQIRNEDGYPVSHYNDFLLIHDGKKNGIDLTHNSSVFSFLMSKLLETHDLETHTHNLRVGKLTSLIGEIMKDYSTEIQKKFVEDKNYLKMLEHSARLHDIGKIMIPDSIKRKPGLFIDNEYEIMKTHTFYGEVLLKGFPYLDFATKISKYHHERVDGKGYYGIEGEEIPIEAQLTSFADIIDALATKRLYKPSYSYDRIKRMIYDGESDRKGNFKGFWNNGILETTINKWDEIVEYHKELKKKF